MVRLSRTVVVAKPVDEVFDYLADFRTTNEWDPATVETVRQDGDGGVGTVYRNTSRFLGRNAELTYRVIDLRPGELVRLEGTNKTLTAVDTMRFRGTPEGTEVTYTAEFSFKGAAKLVAPLLGPAFKKLGDDAERGMRSALQR